MVAHFPDGKTETQWLQSFAQSPKASQQPWLSIWLVLEELCFLLLPSSLHICRTQESHRKRLFMS